MGFDFTNSHEQKNNQGGKDAELSKICKSKEEPVCAEGELLHRNRI